VVVVVMMVLVLAMLVMQEILLLLHPMLLQVIFTYVGLVLQGKMEMEAPTKLVVQAEQLLMIYSVVAAVVMLGLQDILGQEVVVVPQAIF
jgi:hypothetical protein